MKNEDFKKITEEMTEKIGKEKASVVADNFATIISDNMQMNEELKKKEDEIQKLQKDKEDLMTTNMNLLQQIPMGKETERPTEKEPENKPSARAFDFRDVLDEYGNFKR